MSNKGKRYPYKPRRRRKSFKCRHPFVRENIYWHRRWIEKAQRYVYYAVCAKCKRAKRQELVDRVYKPLRRQRRLEWLGTTFPCKHPRTEENSYKDTRGRISCKICRQTSSRNYYRNNRRKVLMKYTPKRKLMVIMGAIEVFECYESDKQCNVCGYMLRYTRSHKCVNCRRDTNTRARLRREAQQHVQAEGDPMD